MLGLVAFVEVMSASACPPPNTDIRVSVPVLNLPFTSVHEQVAEPLFPVRTGSDWSLWQQVVASAADGTSTAAPQNTRELIPTSEMVVRVI
jgi:hypothetical protein